MSSPAVIVPPERETPGISASAWAKPKPTACFMVRSSSWRSCLPTWSATARKMPKSTSMVAVIQRDRNWVSMKSCSSRPRMPIGSEPRMMNQPIRASGSLRSIRPVSESAQCLMMRTMSRQKKMITAVSVPSCVMAVNAAPGSPPPGRNSPTMRRCAEEDTGRNSVRPCTRPRIIASIQFTRQLYGTRTPPRPVQQLRGGWTHTGPPSVDGSPVRGRLSGCRGDLPRCRPHRRSRPRR